MSNFDEQYKSPHVEPAFGNDGIDSDFYERLEERMGEVETLDDADLKTLAQITQMIFDWLTAVNLSDKRCLKAMGMRVLAAAWVLDPKRFGNRSLHNIAQQLEFGANNIAPFTAEFSRLFKVRNQFQSHDWRNHKAD